VKRIRLFGVCFLPDGEVEDCGGAEALRYVWSLKWSLAGFAAAFLLSFLSFGLLGYVLYYAAFPVVGVAYPPLTAWRPDTVWPLIVGAGLVWSFSFIPAGVIDHTLAGRGVARMPRIISFFVVLWLGAVAAWLLLIATNLPPLRH
jgi:hypothetical protein